MAWNDLKEKEKREVKADLVALILSLAAVVVICIGLLTLGIIGIRSPLNR